MPLNIARSITKAVDLAANPQVVFDFIADPLNWPQYAIVNLKAVKKGEGDWYEIESIHGKGQVKLIINREFGILDTLWIDPNASWTVFVRVVPNGEGATLLNTFFQPSHFDDITFDRAMDALDIEFNKLKEILEAS